MAKEFNITGTCIAAKHYMVDTSKKIEAIISLIEKGKYFAINRPRQFGKTTTLSLLCNQLKTNSEYIVFDISFEGIGDVIFDNETVFCPQFFEILENDICKRNPQIAQLISELIPVINSFKTLSDAITQLCNAANAKIVILIDEVDKSSNNQLFLSFLGTLRNKFLDSAAGKDTTFHSVILAGVYDVKTLKLKINPESTGKLNSPWNIAADFKIDMSFNATEIATMLVDYTNAQNVQMDISTISERIYHYTNGYPFLVSRICKFVDEDILPSKNTNEWQVSDIDLAVRDICFERNTNFESLVKHIEDFPDLYQYVEYTVTGYRTYSYNQLNPTIYLGEIHGIFKNVNQKLTIGNKIYEIILTEYITSKLEFKEDITSNIVQSSYLKPNGLLNFEKVLLKFQEVIKEKYSKSDVLKSDEFLEKDLRLLFLVFLKPIINGIGFSFKEVEISEEKCLDIVIIFRDEKFIVELKIWRGDEYHQQGIARLKDYMRRENAQKGYMLIMNKNRMKEFTSYTEENIFMVWI